jgi:hypothetical protein
VLYKKKTNKRAINNLLIFYFFFLFLTRGVHKSVHVYGHTHTSALRKKEIRKHSKILGLFFISLAIEFYATVRL